ncbi:hypothetical protein AQUCO_02500105v1 [Aquilegia coerulea]|uniref:Uncharacterized protein n=1 Tax=Aquilegia coerulea TaxID=218851 RepID=A0A2G5D9I1_AQUCA|nr:hypothetical protein AQUCO_02500105v1 [Aquilegia coerulea]
MSEAPQEFHSEVDLLTFLASTVDKLDGPSHCWLNKSEDSKVPFTRDGSFLVLAGVFLEDSLVLGPDRILMLDKVKYFHRRYPQLHVFGFQFFNSLVPPQTQIVQTIMKDYLTFPILLSNKSFSEVTYKSEIS